MPKTANTLTLIPVAQLRPHPKNPRVALREDVVDAIAADLKERGHMEARHALTVRAVDDGYEIISGHHREAAAVKAGLEGVPCWVVEMNDEEAYMALLSSNAQGELAAIEIGLHALAIGKGDKWSGPKGKAYAAVIGKSAAAISQWKSAAEVFVSCREIIEFSQLNLMAQMATHLYAVHSAKAALWPVIVPHMLKGWSVADTEHWVGKVKEFDIPARCASWLPLAGVVNHFLETKEFSPATVQQLVAKRDAIFKLIEDSSEKIVEAELSVEHYRQAAEEWFVSCAGTGGGDGEQSSWDIRHAHRYLKELEESLGTLSQNQWLHGNWRQHVESIKDESIAVLLTDPPYGMDYQSDYRLDRRKERKHERIENDAAGCGAGELAECVFEFMPKLAVDAHVFVFTNWRNEEAMRSALAEAGLTVRGSLVWVKNNTGMGDTKTTFAPKHERIIHAVKGSPILFEREADVLEYDRANTDRHPTEKPVDLLARLIEITSVKGQRIADPFGGVGSTCEAAESLERSYWGCEINEEYWRHGCERLSQFIAAT